VLVMDGSVVGCGCTALMLHVVDTGRALPLAWRVRQGPKGPFPEELPMALVELVRACLPDGTPVVLLGDGECDGTTLPRTVLSRRNAPPQNAVACAFFRSSLRSSFRHAILPSLWPLLQADQIGK
jgi:hypothetical protein